MSYVANCPFCHCERETYGVTRKHFQGSPFKCGSIPAHTWAGKEYAFERVSWCYRTEIADLKQKLCDAEKEEDDKNKWRYQLVRYRDGSGIGVHEVYCDVAGRPFGMTAEPVRFHIDTDETAASLLQSVLDAAADILRYPILDEPEVWPGTCPGMPKVKK